MSGLSLSSRGFSFEVEVQATASSSEMQVFQQEPEGKLSLKVTPNSSTMKLIIEGQIESATGCSGLASKYLK